MMKPVQTYETDGIAVTFDPNLCRHTGKCLRTLPEVFDITRKRWIRPELATVGAVAAAIEHCPSGALQYALTVPGQGPAAGS